MEHVDLDDVLIREPVGGIVCRGGRLAEVGGGDRRRQGMQFDDKEPEPADVGRPLSQVLDQAFLDEDVR
ncbi:MAG: hypothetical protein R2882_09795 [Gemmatimonadales bacterium]